MRVSRHNSRTYLALVGALARVGPHVAVQLAGVLEGGVAQVARVGPLPSVHPPVDDHVLLRGERLRAELAAGG